ncbi:HD domain-containing phosphohydrolase [Aeribacillus alveayuensis]|uniref:Two-component system response regulator n=1 Tax=Aeribacillus alveayuensis TaxID=279215 RepID=A0ABT9VQF8_9BACI|nr:putative two-component system response regulator [Bacillus alveayuensis]
MASLHPKLEGYLLLADAVIITDRNYRIIAVNKAFENITGYTKQYACGKNPRFLRSNLTKSTVYAELKKELQQGNPWSGVFINKKKSGQLWHSSITITPIKIKDSTYYVGIFRELETLKEGSYISREQATEMKREILKVLAISCEIRDPGIEGHLMRVQKFTEELVYFHNERCQLNLQKGYMNNIINASILHDIGKAGIPEGILYKPGPLTHYEQMIIETHPLIGVDMLDKISKDIELDLLQKSFAIARNVILYHHEKWDGTGYPYKLKGNDIPFEARIISIVDVFDALISRRSYKEAWPMEKALDFLKENSGKHFDPELVESFIMMKESKNKQNEQDDYPMSQERAL